MLTENILLILQWSFVFVGWFCFGFLGIFNRNIWFLALATFLNLVSIEFSVGLMHSDVRFKHCNITNLPTTNFAMLILVCRIFLNVYHWWHQMQVILFDLEIDETFWQEVCWQKKRGLNILFQHPYSASTVSCNQVYCFDLHLFQYESLSTEGIASTWGEIFFRNWSMRCFRFGVEISLYKLVIVSLSLVVRTHFFRQKLAYEIWNYVTSSRWFLT